MSIVSSDLIQEEYVSLCLSYISNLFLTFWCIHDLGDVSVSVFHLYKFQETFVWLIIAYFLVASM